jgi:hypothetical protein
MQERREDPPGGIQLIVTNEVGVVTLQRIENERFVGFGNLEVRESPSVSQVKLCDDSLHAQTGELGVHLNVHTLVGLDADDELIARDVLENT